MFDYTLLHPLFLLTTLLFLHLPSQTRNISINGSLTLTATETSSAWRSPNGDFAFGFQQLQANPDLFVLSIWFDKIPLKTIVWYETSSYPVPRGSTLQLHASDGLLLLDPRGSPLYTTGGGASLAAPVAQAFMQDNGNFVLTAANSSNVLWESFRHPADTILPSQTIEIGEMLVSRKSPTDLARGRFRARMNSTGNLTLRFKTQPSGDDFNAPYYSSQTSNDNNASDSGFRVRFDETASLSVETRDGRPLTYLSYPSVRNASQKYYYRASMDHDGVFTVYYHPKTTSVGGGDRRWSVEQGRPRDAGDICRIITTRGSSACGYNSMCAVVGNGRPGCKCPPGFSPTDPDNTLSDCKSDYSQTCTIDEAAEDDYCSLIEIRDANWPLYDYELIRVGTEQECRDACLRDYFCGAAVLDGTGCWKKSMPITNGRYQQGIKTFLKRGQILNQTQHPGAPDKPEGKKVVIVVVSVLLGSSVLVNLLFAVAAVFFPRIKLLPAAVHNHSNLRCFTYKELVQATNGFTEELGRGGFGTVYKGTLTIPDESRTATVVAVKKLERIAHDSDNKEFRTEVNVIGRIHHRNVVRLLGFCNEGTNRLLVYELMTRGNLASFLFDRDMRPSWRERTRIAVGIARGLAYLHEECSTQIIHCDVKPQNILLDECCTPKISDFGLAKLLMMGQSKTLTDIRGTKGYVSPEWFRNTKITAKVDVYSFGVVLLEIIACRKSVADVENPILSEWARQCYAEGKVEALVEGDDEALRDGGTVERFVKVGLWCVEEEAELRPSMRRVCQMLEGTVEVGVPPLESSFTSISAQL